MSAAPDPIIIRCEGSRCPTHDHGDALGMCAMCGRLVPTLKDGTAFVHDRQDVLAMLDRGDFDPEPSRRSRLRHLSSRDRNQEEHDRG